MAQAGIWIKPQPFFAKALCIVFHGFAAWMGQLASGDLEASIVCVETSSSLEYIRGMGLNDRDYYQKAVDQKKGLPIGAKEASGPLMPRDPFASSKSLNWIGIFGWTVSICAAVFIVARWAMNHVSFH